VVVEMKKMKERLRSRRRRGSKISTKVRKLPSFNPLQQKKSRK